MATSGLSNDTRNFQCVTVASVDVLKLPLRDILANHIQPKDLFQKIKSCSTLKLRKEQLKLCCIPPPGVPDYNKFDVTLLYTLIRNLCSLPCPAQGWGNEPTAKDTQISDDIERLRLFRNNYYVHAESAVISDAVFKDVWRDLKLVFRRIQPKTGCNVDYEEELINIERTQFTDNYLTTFRVLLEAFAKLEKQTDGRDEPYIFIHGENEILCGGTVQFEADVKNVESSCWSIIWQKHRGDVIKRIDTSTEKYSDSTKKTLVINDVCKEDEGEYQAVLSLQSNGPEYKSRNTIRLHVIGEIPFLTISEVTSESEGITIHYNFGVFEQSPKVHHIEWRKDGQQLNIKCKKYVGGGLNDSHFIITSSGHEDRGYYSCTVTNAVGAVEKNIILDVPKVELLIDSPVCFGSETIFKSVISSTPTPEKIEWQKSIDLVNFQPIEKPNYFGSSDNFKCPFLVIPKVTFDDTLYYRLLVWNGIGMSSSNIVFLNVTGSPPNVTISLETNIKNKSVKLIGNVFVYDDSPRILETFWTKNVKTIDLEGSSRKCLEENIGSLSLTIKNVSPDDAGEYRLTAINAVGLSTSEVIVLGVPSVFQEKIEDKNEGQCITMTIESFPVPHHVQWSAKSKDEEIFTPININAEEYKGTTVSFPHPVLVVRQGDQLEKNCYQIEVANFIGKTVLVISCNITPAVLRNTENTLYKDRGESIRFAKLFTILAEQFPIQKLESLKYLIVASSKMKDPISIKKAETTRECLMILLDENLFTETDVIFMQFLCKETGCLDLYAKCIDYAVNHNALCYFEKPSVTGYTNVQFHVRGELTGYTKEYTRQVIKTVAAILDCKEEDIILQGVRHSTSFLLFLSVKKVYSLKLLALNEQDRLKLRILNIDYLIIDKDTIFLEKPKELKKDGKSWLQHISPTLKELADSITDSILMMPTDSSFAHELINEVNQGFVNVIQSLSRRIEIFKKINTAKHTNEPGKVYVFDVQVKCRGNHFTVVKEDTEDWNSFRHADSEDLIKVIRVQSRSMRVIEAKLQVYRKFADDINKDNIFLQHILEDYDEIAKRSAHKKISWFCNIIDLLIKSLTLCDLCKIITKASNQVLTQDALKTMCNNIFVEYSGENIGTVDSSSYFCDSKNVVERIKGLLKGNVITVISDDISSIICSEIANHFRLLFKSSQKGKAFAEFNELPDSIRNLIENAVKLHFFKMSVSDDESRAPEHVKVSEEDFFDDADLTRSTSSSGMAYAFSHSLDDSTVNVNSRYWREDVANELFCKIIKRGKHILSNIEVTIQEIFETTKTELRMIIEGIRKCQSKMQLVDQKSLVEIWKKRELKGDKEALVKQPPVLHYIAGTKYENPFVKVFVRQDLGMQKTFLEDTTFEFVNVFEKSAKKRELEKIKSKEKEAPILSDDIRIDLNKIINSQAETIYANHTTVSGLGVSNVRYEGNNLINDPCIVIYCLDKFLIPYGETPLPKHLEGYPCDKREGVFMFGYCADCRNVSPNPGCSIGMPYDKYTGSAGFTVKSTGPNYLTGFLTAAHVSIDELLDLYEEGLLLSRCRCDFAERKHEIIHPSWSYFERNNVIGEVKESFIGNFQDTLGIDAAFVQSYQKRLGEINGMQLAEDHTLTFDGKTRVTKKGQTNGLTYGLLQSNSLSICISFSRFPGTLISFNNCYEIKDEDIKDPFFKEGDSGSGVFVIGNGKPQKPLGIAFAYQSDGDITVVCKIQPIIEACNLTICQEEVEMESS